MRTVLPGKPQGCLQAHSTARWVGQRLVVYISGNALVVLNGPQNLLQTIYLDDCDSLSAVVIDERSGKIAVCGDGSVFIYKPYGEELGNLRWILHLTIRLAENCDFASTSLSWGSEEELLTGNTSLGLYQTVTAGRQIWFRTLPEPVKSAAFSPDSNFVASVGWQDRLVKLWRRQSFDPDDTRFGFTYLSHPSSVTTIHWRNPPVHEHHHHEQTVDSVLYSISTDNKIRIWAAMDPYGISHMQLWAQIDMLECLQPRQLGTTPQRSERSVFFVDQDEFSKATSHALNFETEAPEGDTHTLEHLAEIAKAKPDVCVMLDGQGNMSAWGLERIGSKARKDTDIFNIAHVRDFSTSFTQTQTLNTDQHLVFSCFASDDSSSALSLLVHSFDGRISWHDAEVEELFDPSPRDDRITLRALWTGHEKPITKLSRDITGQSLLSRTDENESLVWRRDTRGVESVLPRQSTIVHGSSILCSCVLERGQFLLTLHLNEICLWDTRASKAQRISCCNLKADHGYICLLLLPHSSMHPQTQYVATIKSNMSGQIWKCTLPERNMNGVMANGADKTQGLAKFCSFNVKLEDELALLASVDPAGSSPMTFNEVTSFANPVAVSASKAGNLYSWAANVDPEHDRADFRLLSIVNTHITDPSLASGSSTYKVAVVDSTCLRLTIWDTRSSQMEYEEIFDSLDTILDLDWSYTLDSQSLLAAGSPYKVRILAQMRYDYTYRGPAWASVREIHTKGLTSHPIGDSVWLNNGNLVIGAGNQLYVCSEEVSMTSDIVTDLHVPIHGKANIGLLDLVSYLNGPLPVYNPQFLGQSMLAGHVANTVNVVLALDKALKYFAPGDDLDSYLSLPLRCFYSPQSVNVNGTSPDEKTADEESEDLSEEKAMSLTENLSKIAVPHLTSAEQLHLADGIECLALVGKQQRAMDVNALRYYFFLSQHMLRKGQGRYEVLISWREYTWALHSSSQDLLVDHVSKQFRGRLQWKQASESGMFMWLKDPSALHAQFEVIARNEYTKTEEKNPIDCSLYYFALRKKNVLLGLWRMATWNREQIGTQRLLKNNFSESRWKTAALKNAYALLGKRRFEYAAAWFLLAGSLQDAVNVCFHQMEDLQLAIAVARVYDGDRSSVLRTLLQQKVLPQAAHEGNRWQATWAFTILEQHDMAIKALIEPLHDLIPLSQPPKAEVRSYLAHDPALIVLYKQLRDKFMQKSRAVNPISPRAEWEMVINTARTYDRMGCDLLALDLLRNWKFLSPSQQLPPPIEVRKERRKSGRRRSSANVPTTPKSPTKEKPKPTMFKEPEASSLLDSFGF